MENKSRNIKIIACIISLISIMSVTGIFAYLTEADMSYNKFTVGEVKIDIIEKKWNDAKNYNDENSLKYVENIVPNSIIEKDPLIENVGENSAYVYFKVKIPSAKVVVADEYGNIENSEPQDTPLFDYEVNNGWQEIVSERDTVKNSSGKIEYYTYVYCYDKVLAKSEKTNTLFKNDEVKFKNIIEQPEDLDSSNSQIVLEGYAIQSENLPKDITTSQGAYAIYLNQNK